MNDTPSSRTGIPDIPAATDADVFITRAFVAPREVVWKFFTEPEYLARWFGPAAVHIDPSTVQVQLHPGGLWGLDMVDNATGEHYPMRARLTVVIPPEYLEGAEATADTAIGPLEGIRLRIWLHDHGDKTRLTLHQGPFTPEFRDMTRDGWLESFHKVDEILAGGGA
jgi:uncharacterized protein YndB with AHSA1/START domain